VKEEEENTIHETRALCDFEISTILHVLLLQMINDVVSTEGKLLMFKSAMSRFLCWSGKERSLVSDWDVQTQLGG
jgi:hypothetical protein